MAKTKEALVTVAMNVREESGVARLETQRHGRAVARYDYDYDYDAPCTNEAGEEGLESTCASMQ